MIPGLDVARIDADGGSGVCVIFCEAGEREEGGIALVYSSSEIFVRAFSILFVLVVVKVVFYLRNCN